MPVFAKYDGVDGESKDASNDLNLDLSPSSPKSAINSGANDIIRGGSGDDVIRLTSSDGGFCVYDDGNFHFEGLDETDDPDMPSDVVIIVDRGNDAYNDMTYADCDPFFRLSQSTEADYYTDDGEACADSGEAHLDYLIITMGG